MVKVKILLFITVASLMAACDKTPHNPGAAKADSYYITGSRESREHLQDLFMLLAREDNSAESAFAVIREITNSYAIAGEYGRLIHFLGERTINFPDDPYNSYYLLMIAYAYMQQDSLPVAVQYFDLIVKNYPDLIINDKSIHFVCLNQLINLTKYPVQQVWYYQELISRFSDMIDLGVAWFMLAQIYERIGDWNSSIQAYSRYLTYAGSMIPGFPNAENYARQQVDFNNSSKNWTYESLPALLSAVREALDTMNPYQLMLCQARVNFFIRSWEQGETDESGMADFSVSDFMRGDRIYYANELDASSNSTEAYLRTWGWNQYVTIWYLYFRKIYFPSDPEIHGHWEWAGIFYGEKF